MALYNIQGVQIRNSDLDSKSSQTHELDVNGLPSGLYILRITDKTSGLLKTERIIVK